MTRKISEKPLGVITSVTGDIAEVGMYEMTNDSKILWDGEILNGPKIGAYISIQQNDINIIASVITEQILDQKNTIKSKEFDNRYVKNSINRIIRVKVKGILEGGEFKVTSSYVPMIGNQVVLISKKELEIIYGVGDPKNNIYVGKSLMEEQPVYLSIDKLFASHIGIFGNTGSGKSNTLHKLYIELFRSKYKECILRDSQFFVIDFNGEYVGDNMFGLSSNYKNIFMLDTSRSDGPKIPILKDYFYDADILSILFDARPATQVPFLRSAILKFKEVLLDNDLFHTLEIGLLENIIQKYNKINGNSLDNWIAAAKICGVNGELFSGLESFFYKNDYGDLLVQDHASILLVNGRITEAGYTALKINEISDELIIKFRDATNIRKLYYFLLFQKVYVTTWNKQNERYIDPLFNRIETGIRSLENVIELVDTLEGEYKPLNIVSLVKANQEITRLIPMLLSKMVYDEQKIRLSNEVVSNTKHLIIDEAHNILNGQVRNNGDSWQDYRLSVFEEIIKEGRKFGFYLTLSSQRPADISSTVLSQTHNYIIHRLVNDNDLRMVENTMPTLDRTSFAMVPNLGQGEAIITGTVLDIPLFTKIDKEEHIRPNSDDVKLTSIWKNCI